MRKRQNLKLRKSARCLMTLVSLSLSFLPGVSFMWGSSHFQHGKMLGLRRMWQANREKSFAKLFSFPSLHVKPIIKLEAITLLSSKGKYLQRKQKNVFTHIHKRESQLKPSVGGSFVSWFLSGTKMPGRRPASFRQGAKSVIGRRDLRKESDGI